jgi:polyphosphate kinase
MFLEDVIRFNLRRYYSEGEIGDSYAFKLSRDAELYLEDEFSGDLVQMIRKSLQKRDTGLPCRFLYDLRSPFALAELLKYRLDLNNSDMVPGGRYHNLNDLFGFPDFGKQHLRYEPMPPVSHPGLTGSKSMLDAIAAGDHLLHFPYQSYDPVIRFFEEAAEDEAVEEIWVSLYRVAKDSAIAAALISAQRRGKRVTAFVEVKARFDEASNLYWAEQMEQAGVRVLYSMPGLKVHAKIALVLRREGEALRGYAFLGTGNFNEKTARHYGDIALLTADKRLTGDVEQVFGFLNGERTQSPFDHLLVAPFAMRKGFYRLIDAEIERARAGEEAAVLLKMNSLEDEKIIRRLYKASNAGVRIQIVVRGICRLIPGVPGQSERIEVISIVDRFLERTGP